MVDAQLLDVLERPSELEQTLLCPVEFLLDITNQAVKPCKMKKQVSGIKSFMECRARQQWTNTAEE